MKVYRLPKIYVMKKWILLSLLVIMASLQMVAQTSGVIYVDVDDASHVVLTCNNSVVPLENGKNAVEYKTWQTLLLAPADGYLIDSVNAFDTEGNPATSVWWFDSSSDSYSTQFTSYNYDNYTYKVTTHEYHPDLSSVEVYISDATAVKEGTYTVGNVSVTAKTGDDTVSFNPEKGNKFTVTLVRGVSEAALTLNDVAQEADENAFGEIMYTFNVSDGDVIRLDAQMETPVFNLCIDDPQHVRVFFPDQDSRLLDLAAGDNQLQYAVGDILTVKAEEGWKIISAEGLRYSSYTDSYSYTFKGGESGMQFTIGTEEYNPPMAEFIIDLEKPELLSRIVSDVVTTKFEAGQNVIKVNLEKEDYLQIVYKINSADEVEAKLDGEPLPVEESWIYSSTIDNLEPKTYHLVIGTPGWTPGSTALVNIQDSDIKVNIYSADGRVVRLGVKMEILDSLPDGIYIVDGKKIKK